MAGARLITRTLTITSGNDYTSTLDLEGYTPVALVVPQAITSTTFNPLVRVFDGGSFYQAYNADGTQYAITVVAGTTHILLDPSNTHSWQTVYFQGDETEGADRTLYLVLREL